MDQKAIWDYYQGEETSVFSNAAPRLSFLVKSAMKLSSPKGMKILNIGVGGGFLEQYAATKGFIPYSLDPSEVAIRKLEQKGLNGKVGYVQDIPYEDQTFGFVFCSEVLEHLNDDILNGGVREINRVLTNTGYLIGTVPYSETLAANQVICPCCNTKFHKWGHEQSFDKATMKDLLQRYNFKILKLETYSFQSFAGKNLKGKIRALGGEILGRLGVSIAGPNLFFIAQRGK